MPDISCVDDQTDVPFTKAQFAAARFMVARLRAEAAGEKFEPSDIGMVFSSEHPAAIVDGELIITAMDFIRANLLLLWSMVMDTSDIADEDPATIIAMMGLSLAEHDPA